jgi:hypothetical protein
VFVSSHHGQHSADCYGCKLNSITFDRGRPKTHVKNGDPWKDNPVVDRINELQAEGRRVAAFEVANTPAAPTEEN